MIGLFTSVSVSVAGDAYKYMAGTVAACTVRARPGSLAKHTKGPVLDS